MKTPNGIKKGDLVCFRAWYGGGTKLVAIGIGQVERITPAGRLAVMCDGKWAGAFGWEHVGWASREGKPISEEAAQDGLVQVSENYWRRA